jgi:hypothetical protein
MREKRAIAFETLDAIIVGLSVETTSPVSRRSAPDCFKIPSYLLFVRPPWWGWGEEEAVTAT